MSIANRIPFRCPICRCQVCVLLTPERLAAPDEPVKVRKPPVFQCAGCSVLFSDPDRFTRFEPHPTASLHPAPDFKQGWKR